MCAVGPDVDSVLTTESEVPVRMLKEDLAEDQNVLMDKVRRAQATVD